MNVREMQRIARYSEMDWGGQTTRFFGRYLFDDFGYPSALEAFKDSGPAFTNRQDLPIVGAFVWSAVPGSQHGNVALVVSSTEDHVIVLGARSGPRMLLIPLDTWLGPSHYLGWTKTFGRAEAVTA